MRYLIDTNVLSELRRKQPDARVPALSGRVKGQDRCNTQ